MYKTTVDLEPRCYKTQRVSRETIVRSVLLQINVAAQTDGQTFHMKIMTKVKTVALRATRGFSPSGDVSTSPLVQKGLLCHFK